ncbi:hypothetical protein [Escherichia phage vB_EcoP_PAS7]|uniref:Uncharacterized protein n=1 Tax=Escherichia phage vB_EcoP_PAS7 TaxID=3053875 RepID=A0AA51Z013_9CAUD|nr:hypothetical protein [Escherichia phage vB_EcoP_PAS7]
MTINLSSLNSLVNSTVEAQGIDQSVTQSGGNFADVLLPRGSYYGRFMEYIELGKKIPMHMGKPTGKPAVMNVRLGFIVYTPDGSIKRINPFPMAISSFEKAKFKQVFDKMNYDGTLKHMAQRLGQAFMFEVEQYTSKTGKTSNTIDFLSLRQLPKFDPNTGAPIELPALDESGLRLFLFDNPTKETWDSLHIEKNNFIQEDILQAVNFEGSALQQMLMGGVPDMAAMAAPAAAPAAPVALTAPAAPAAPMTAPVAPAMPAAPVAPAI